MAGRQDRLRPLRQTPAGFLRTAEERADEAERALVELRQALAQVQQAWTAEQTTEIATELLTEPQAARVLGIGLSTLKKLTRSGELRSVKIGAAKRIRRCDLDAYLASLTGNEQ
jgi:excisionase family DNA binding protein